MSDNEQLFVPDRIKVGFQKRDDTYTGKLAFVTYFDKKGELRMATSWGGWCHKNIPPIEYDNVPIEGFVLNKGVGGARHSYGWNVRNEYIRVYDPRDFEFEISVANLLFVLRECDCSRGKGLDGKFVLAWHKGKVVLLPVVSQEYQKSKQFTELQAKKIGTRDLIPGATYITKRQQLLLFIGKLDYYHLVTHKSDDGYSSWRRKTPEKYISGVCKRFVFWDAGAAYPKPKGDDDDDPEVENDRGFVYLDGLNSLAAMHSDTVPENFADLAQRYYRSGHGSKVVKLFIKPNKKASREKSSRSWNWWREENGYFFHHANTYEHGKPMVRENLFYIQSDWVASLDDGIIRLREDYRTHYMDNSRHFGYAGRVDERIPYREPTDDQLYVQMESGSTVLFDYGHFSRR